MYNDDILCISKLQVYVWTKHITVDFSNLVNLAYNTVLKGKSHNTDSAGVFIFVSDQFVHGSGGALRCVAGSKLAHSCLSKHK